LSPSCADGVQNGGEAGVDCGPICASPCPAGSPCFKASDCTSGLCVNISGMFVCAAPTCSDGVKNGPETGKDCGGGCPSKCEPGAGCVTGADCIGGVCNAVTKTCDPTCTDGVWNGPETDIDCGGPCPQKCGVGLHCNDDIDCITASCYQGHCYP
jgi:hypothetical protein